MNKQHPEEGIRIHGCPECGLVGLEIPGEVPLIVSLPADDPNTPLDPIAFAARERDAKEANDVA